jgi:hypothetical protein
MQADYMAGDMSPSYQDDLEAAVLSKLLQLPSQLEQRWGEIIKSTII